MEIFCNIVEIPMLSSKSRISLSCSSFSMRSSSSSLLRWWTTMTLLLSTLFVVAPTLSPKLASINSYMSFRWNALQPPITFSSSSELTKFSISCLKQKKNHVYLKLRKNALTYCILVIASFSSSGTGIWLNEVFATSVIFLASCRAFCFSCSRSRRIFSSCSLQ